MSKGSTKVTAPRRLLSDAEQHSLYKLSAHTTEEVQSYLKPPEGLERVAPKIFDLLARHPSIVGALKLDTSSLREALGEASKLSTLEDAARILYRRAMENRLEHESDVYRSLLKLNRFVQNADDADLEHEFADLAAWISDTHASSRAAQNKPAQEVTAAPSGPTGK